MVKQQSTQHQNQEETNPLLGEKIGADLLLRGWNMALEVVNEAIQHNSRSGVRYPERFTSVFFDHMEPMEIKKKRNWLAACINIKSGDPIHFRFPVKCKCNIGGRKRIVWRPTPTQT